MTPERSGEGTFDRRYERVARRLLAMGVRPNHFTFLQIPVFAVMIWAALNGRAWTFFAFSLLVIVLDGGDGILARVGGLQSRVGAALDAIMDTIGIAVVMWGASRFFEWATWWLLAIFLLNGLLYVQNMVLDEKVVSYVRGPVIVPIIVPDMLMVGFGMATLITAFLLVTRLGATARAMASARPQPPAP